MDQSYERSIAVIGSGVAGLTAAYVLAGRDRVTLFEADVRLGGHAHTHFLDAGDGSILGVDSAFLVHNDRTYPTLCRLFDELGVATQESEMSMSVRADDHRQASNTPGPWAFGGCSRAGSRCGPATCAMLAEIVRFHRAAPALLRRQPGRQR